MARGGFHTTIVFNNYVFIAERQAELIKLGLTRIMIQAQAEAKQLVRKDTRTLMKSIKYRNVEALIYEMYTNVEYAVYNEFGTSKMPAKPFMFPAAKNAGARIEAMVGAVLSQTG